tara:strand:+ start:88 stop:852 length:765 start_codon:yes stop_codon:yes gene_type:complete
MNNKLFELINNKKVVVVGAADYLQYKNIDNIIDKYDVVVRINRGTRLQDKKGYGSRTDVLYHCLCQKTGGKLTPEIYNKYKIIVGAIPPLYPLDKDVKNSSFPNTYIHMYNSIPKYYSNKFTCVNKIDFLKLENDIGCRPYTGVITIYHLLKQKPAELYITGMTFGKGGTNSIYKKDNTIQDWINHEKNAGYPKSHDNYLIWLYTKEMIKNSETKIILDQELKEILEFDIEKYRKRLNMDNLTDKEIYIHYLLN